MLVRPPCAALLLGLSGRGALITTCEYCYKPRCMKTHEVRTRKGNNGRDVRIEFMRPGVLRRRAFVAISSARQGYALRAFSCGKLRRIPSGCCYLGHSLLLPGPFRRFTQLGVAWNGASRTIKFKQGTLAGGILNGASWEVANEFRRNAS